MLGVTRSVIAGHGGEVRLIEKRQRRSALRSGAAGAAKERAAPPPAANAAPARFGRRMTALVIEPDEAAQRQLLALLRRAGFRVVPVDNSDTGLDLAQRMRFDAAFCSLHAPGLNWVELSERMHTRGSAGSFCCPMATTPNSPPISKASASSSSPSRSRRRNSNASSSHRAPLGDGHSLQDRYRVAVADASASAARAAVAAPGVTIGMSRVSKT